MARDELSAHLVLLWCYSTTHPFLSGFWHTQCLSEWVDLFLSYMNVPCKHSHSGKPKSGLLRISVLWRNSTDSLSLHISQISPHLLDWKLFQHALSVFLIGIFKNSIISSSNSQINLSGFFCPAVYLLFNYLDSFLSSIITDLINNCQTMCLPQVEKISELAPCILPSDANSVCFLWVSVG